jgi:hypothetical protein
MKMKMLPFLLLLFLLHGETYELSVILILNPNRGLSPSLLLSLSPELNLNLISSLILNLKAIPTYEGQTSVTGQSFLKIPSSLNFLISKLSSEVTLNLSLGRNQTRISSEISGTINQIMLPNLIRQLHLQILKLKLGRNLPSRLRKRLPERLRRQLLRRLLINMLNFLQENILLLLYVREALKK